MNNRLTPWTVRVRQVSARGKYCNAYYQENEDSGQAENTGLDAIQNITIAIISVAIESAVVSNQKVKPVLWGFLKKMVTLIRI